MILAFPADSSPVVRLSDSRRYIPIALLVAGPALRYMSWSQTVFDTAEARRHDVPPLRIGRWVVPSERNVDLRDANHDGFQDIILLLDKRALVRAGELHVGRNRLIVTGATSLRNADIERSVPSGREHALFIPFRGEVVIDVVK